MIPKSADGVRNDHAKTLSRQAYRQRSAARPSVRSRSRRHSPIDASAAVCGMLRPVCLRNAPIQRNPQCLLLRLDADLAHIGAPLVELGTHVASISEAGNGAASSPIDMRCFIWSVSMISAAALLRCIGHVGRQSLPGPNKPFQKCEIETPSRRAPASSVTIRHQRSPLSDETRKRQRTCAARTADNACRSTIDKVMSESSRRSRLSLPGRALVGNADQSIPYSRLMRSAAICDPLFETP